MHLLNSSVEVERVLQVADLISDCDFQVTVQNYMTGNEPRPWIITVGEFGWQRHLVIKDIADDDVTLLVLSHEQSGNFGYHIDIKDVSLEVKLVDLIKDSYSGVKNVLHPLVLA